MPIKKIQIPAPKTITFKHPRTLQDVEEAWDFKKFLEHFLSMPTWVKDYNAVRSASEVLKAYDKAVPADNLEEGAEDVLVMQLAEEDWKRIRDCIEKPEQGLALLPEAARGLLDYMDAVVKAADA